MVFTFLAARGLPVGASLVEADKVDTARQLEALVRQLIAWKRLQSSSAWQSARIVCHAFQHHIPVPVRSARGPRMYAHMWW